MCIFSYKEKNSLDGYISLLLDDYFYSFVFYIFFILFWYRFLKVKGANTWHFMYFSYVFRFFPCLTLIFPFKE